jgi:transcription-repair coupling factor (superfamily II helicase)
MHLTGLVELLRAQPAYTALVRALRGVHGVSPAGLGVMRAARPITAAALAADWHGPVVYLTGRVDRAYNVSEQLPVWLGEATTRIARYAEPSALFYERSAWGDAALRGRIETLAALIAAGEPAAGAEPPFVVASARALMQRTLPPERFRDACMELQVGQRLPVEKTVDRWVKMGYEPTTVVIDAGQFSRRGGILDIFPLSSAQPVRIELFDDEIDSVRIFNPTTQRTTERIQRVTIPPAREALPEDAGGVNARLSGWFAGLRDAAADMTSAAADAAALEAGTAFPYIEFYMPYLYPSPASLLDYAPADALIVIEDWRELRDTVGAIEEAAEKTRAERAAAEALPPDYPAPYLSWADFETALAKRHVVILGAGESETAGEGRAASLKGLFAPEQRFGGQLKPLLAGMRAMRGAGDRVLAVTPQAARIADLWRESGEGGTATLMKQMSEPPAPRTTTLVEGSLQEGWRLRLTGENTDEGGDLHLFTDAEIFGWSRSEPRRRRNAPKRGRRPDEVYADLREGDYVVHVDYGVGRFAGLRRRTIDEVEREYLMIEYAGNDTVFVPIHQADRLSRYVGQDDTPPPLNKLGQQDWIRIRTKAQKAAEEEARELLAVYAERAAADKVPSGPDAPWQHEIEASFPYIETDDQLKAVAAVKRDMEQPHPMDRLICGDVGYGKTEVALRAAFKAVMDGRQVAVLVPTTILAQQHYENFSRRMAAFPVRVEVISRFRTREQQNTVLRALTAGDVDILIGTHRLLGDDVAFRDLGLVIIDEEQRFGVKHKEHFKRLRAAVDVLTLTATPIPRTLYMSLSGVRDISMIQTPPEERLAVITHVGPFDENLVRSAVLREMERGGQVFVVHNRVSTIELLATRLSQIVPDARIAIGHGQMDERQLEHVMAAFGNGEYDILLSTSIIESGLDIPNANTLIVDRADWFGLAQLYQLRGRVGRSAQQAYAYFFHPAHNRLNDDARARLETLAEYTNLGSGYQIAMRDLELRGAGDILSARQSGHVAAIGLHLYTQMLAQAVRDLRRVRPQHPAAPAADADAADETAVASAVAAHAPAAEDDEEAPLPISQNMILIDVPMPAYLPTDWIPDIGMRLQIYRRIGGLTSLPQVDAMRVELIDRFGALPEAVEGLLYQIEIKLLGQSAKASAVVARGRGRDRRVEIRLAYLSEINREHLASTLSTTLNADVRVSRTAVELHMSAGDDWQALIRRVLVLLEPTARLAVRLMEVER